MQATRTILAAAISVLLINHAYAVNESTQDQAGSDNYADVTQRGEDSSISQRQSGTGNVVYAVPG